MCSVGVLPYIWLFPEIWKSQKTEILRNKIEIVFNELDSNKATSEAVFFNFSRILCFLFIWKQVHSQMMAQQMKEQILHLSHETDVMELSKKMTKKKLLKQAFKFFLFSLKSWLAANNFDECEWSRWDTVRGCLTQLWEHLAKREQ